MDRQLEQRRVRRQCLVKNRCREYRERAFSQINSLPERPIFSLRRVPVDDILPQRSLRRRDTTSQPSLRIFPVARDAEPRCGLAGSAFRFITTDYTTSMR